MKRRTELALPTISLFTWQLADNRLVADDVYAHFYGFDAARLVEGVSVEEVIGRIVEQDREEAARATHKAILSGAFTTVSFRVVQNGSVRTLVSFGRCLRDADGTPSIFTGGLFDTMATFVPGLSSTALCH